MKIIGMLPVFNDEDVIQEVIEYLLSQEIELVVLDNGSTDKTYEICKQFLSKGILQLKQFKTISYQWDTILRMLYDMAQTYTPDWVIRSDSDEFLESGIKNKTLKQAIEDADKDGYNLIQFDRFDFFMTDDDNEDAKSVREKLKYYSYQGDFLYRAWKYIPGIRIGDAGGHYPIFPEGYPYSISTKKFILRHYTFRSKKQAEKKMADRIRNKGEKSQQELPLDHHEKKILKQEFSKNVDHNLLNKYEEDGKWNYELKYCPFTENNPPKKEDVFSDNGFLKNRPKSSLDYKLSLIEKEEEIQKIKEHYAYAYRAKMFFRRMREKIFK